jgi:putative membrane protein
MACIILGILVEIVKKGERSVMWRIVPYFNEICMLISGFCVAAGWGQIRKKEIESHRRLMITATIFAALFFIGYASKMLFIGDTPFSGPAQYRPAYLVFLTTHSTLASIGAILGAVSLRLAGKKRFAQHKKLGPWTAVVWFITVISGFIVFLLLYIIYPT